MSAVTPITATSTAREPESRTSSCSKHTTLARPRRGCEASAHARSCSTDFLRGVLAVLRLAAPQRDVPPAALHRYDDRDGARRRVAAVPAGAARRAGRRLRAVVDRPLRLREEQAGVVALGEA